MKRGFTLVEMLVVMGIIAVLCAAAFTGFQSAVVKAQNAKCQELVHNVATALAKVQQDEGGWPRRILAEGRSSGTMTPEVGAELARRKALSLNYRLFTNEETGEMVYRLVGFDQCGVVSPWAAEVVKKKAAKGGGVSTGEDVPTGGKIANHVLRFAVDDDEDGRTVIRYEGDSEENSVVVRAPAVVWCCGRDGKFGTKDDIKSWAKGQEE